MSRLTSGQSKPPGDPPAACSLQPPQSVPRRESSPGPGAGSGAGSGAGRWPEDAAGCPGELPLKDAELLSADCCVHCRLWIFLNPSPSVKRFSSTWSRVISQTAAGARASPLGSGPTTSPLLWLEEGGMEDQRCRKIKNYIQCKESQKINVIILCYNYDILSQKLDLKVFYFAYLNKIITF